MGHRTAPEGHRVVVVAPYGRDAPAIAKVLQQEGYDATVCPTLAAAAESFDEHVGVVLVTEEALRGDLAPLEAALRAQPPWSDIPFVLLAAVRRGARSTAEAARMRLPDLVTSVIVIERPTGRASLISAIATAMRTRQKQFEMRDRLAELDAARRDLVASEATLRLTTEAAEIGLWDVDPISDTLFWPPRVKAMFGISPDVPVTMADFYGGIHPEDLEATSRAYASAIDPETRAVYDVEYRTIGKEDGVIRWIAAKGRGLFDEGGRCIRVLGTAIDITRRKAVELELVALTETLEQRVAERSESLMQAEAALRQSQKMEAVGQLTGGIAHDFNNMLTGVIGSLDIIRRRLASGRTDDLDRFMDAASQSAKRAARLTERLLAFSRRQSLDPKPIDVNALLSSLDDLLRRTVSENIALKIVGGPDVPRAVADGNQLENAIINLVINARDAMPEGGEVTIDVAAAEIGEGSPARGPEMKAGRYVVITVSDSGVGMAPDIVEKIFDPFFTTKPVGQGTGLGLSMVYGFARQSGGQVLVRSRPGDGTTVSIYLPAQVGTDETVEEASASPVPEGDGQVVLLVEDDDSVRLLVRDVLEELHYTAIEVHDAHAAVSVLASRQRLDLMISDVGLPGINGRQLAEIARQHRPDIPILFVTGYAENAAIRAGFLGTNMAMITKPFAVDTLAGKISEMLSGRALPDPQGGSAAQTVLDGAARGAPDL